MCVVSVSDFSVKFPECMWSLYLTFLLLSFPYVCGLCILLCDSAMCGVHAWLGNVKHLFRNTLSSFTVTFNVNKHI